MWPYFTSNKSAFLNADLQGGRAVTRFYRRGQHFGEERLFAMLPESNPLRQFFNELVERNYAEVGIHNLEVQSYVVNLLTEFCESETLYKIKTADGRPLADGFRYTSDDNPARLSPTQIRALVASLDGSQNNQNTVPPAALVAGLVNGSAASSLNTLAAALK